MAEVPLICPLCGDPIAEAKIRSHNKENHEGKGLVPPPPRKDQAILQAMRDS